MVSKDILEGVIQRFDLRIQHNHIVLASKKRNGSQVWNLQAGTYGLGYVSSFPLNSV